MKLASFEDEGIVLHLCRKFFDESRYSSLPYSEDSVRKMFYSIVGGSTKGVILLTTKDDKYTGILVAVEAKLPFSDVRVASELMMYIEDRKTRDFFHLLDAYEYWATNILHVDIIQLSTLADNPTLEKYYLRRGYVKSEEAYTKGI